MAAFVMPMSMAGCFETGDSTTTTTADGEYNQTTTGSTGDTTTGYYTVPSKVTWTSQVAGTPGTEEVLGTKYQLLPGDFCIIKKGEVASTIVIADDAGTVARSAAIDLAENLKKMTGKTFAIKTDAETIEGNKILVGRSRYTDALELKLPSQYPGNEMFRVISSANILVLAGNDAGAYQGTQFAVTYLLETLGFGWFGVDELWNVVPTGDTIYIKECNVLSEASFSSRYTRLSSAEPFLGMRWYAGGQPVQVTHELQHMIPKSLYKDHPEYFALVGGTRDPEDRPGKTWYQPCLSNPDVQNLVAEKVIKFFEDNPTYTGASIAQYDCDVYYKTSGNTNWCECDECKKLGDDFTQCLVQFANIIGRKIKDVCPGKTVTIFGYAPTYDAPTIKMEVEDNVLLMLCKEGGLTRFIRNGNLFNDDLQQTQFKDNYLNWKNAGLKHIGIYEWQCPGAGNDKWKDMFWVQGEVFLDNLRWAKENGVEFFFLDQGPLPYYERSEGYLDIRWPLWYVAAKGMWDCSLTFEDIMMPACEKLYGAAAEDMYNFYKALNDANKNCATANYWWELVEPKLIYTEKWVNKAETALNSAFAKASTLGGEVLERVENQRENWIRTKSYL